MKLTTEQLQERLARNPSLAAVNPAFAGLTRAEVVDGIVRSAKPLIELTRAISVDKTGLTKKPLLNKTESLWKTELERRGHKIILAQALTLRLGDRLNYRPDLVTVELDFKTMMPGAIALTCWETKAPHRFKTAGITKIKAAAKQYPFIRFVLVMRDKSKWTEREIGSE